MGFFGEDGACSSGPRREKFVVDRKFVLWVFPAISMISEAATSGGGALGFAARGGSVCL